MVAALSLHLTPSPVYAYLSEFSCCPIQVRRAGGLAVTKAVADKAQLELLDLDANEISDSAVDDIKVQVLSLPASTLQQAYEAQCRKNDGCSMHGFNKH